jgi:hypothetical protein
MREEADTKMPDDYSPHGAATPNPLALPMFAASYLTPRMVAI